MVPPPPPHIKVKLIGYFLKYFEDWEEANKKSCRLTKKMTPFRESSFLTSSVAGIGRNKKLLP